MPNTYTQIYVQIVFTVKGEANIIPEKKRDEDRVPATQRHKLDATCSGKNQAIGPSKRS